MKYIFTTLFLVLISLIISTEAKAQSSVEAIIIEQPNDVIECEGSLDQYLFVVAAPSDRQYKIAYRWLKDDRPISTWVEDFGQLTFDTLRYRMSGLYNAELFAYDPNWTSAYGNAFSYDSARVSPIVSSERVNLYVLQPPSFMKEIEYQIVKKGDDCIFTFDANIYGEHNMEDPTYWTDIQWFKDSVALIDGDRISGSQSSILTINNIKETDYSTKYRVRLSGDCDTIWSNVFAINPVPELLLKYYTRKDAAGVDCINKKTQFWVGFGTNPPHHPIDYQWYLNGKPFKAEKNKYEFKYSNSKLYTELDEVELTITWNLGFDNELLQHYQCEYWPRGYPDKKNKVDMYEVYWFKPIKLITDLDEEYTVEENKNISFGVETESDSIIYKWFKDSSILNNTTNTLNIINAELEDTGIYYVEMSNGCGELTSKKAVLTVTPKQTITGIEDNSSQEISVYPNPFTANSTLTINPKSTGKVSVILADVLGNKLATVFDDLIQIGQQKSINLNLDNIGLSSGTYYIIIRMGDKVETRQISVVR